VFDAGAAVLVLLVTTTLSVYKPWGRIGQHAVDAAGVAESVHGQRKGLPTGLRVFLAIVGAIVATVIIVHLAGGGMGRH
jgi:hypothetical protein